MKHRLSRSTKLVVVSLALVLVMIAAIAFGLLQWLAPNVSISRRAAAGSLVVYWLAFFAIVWLIPAALRRPKEALLSIVSTGISLVMLELACRILVPGASVIGFTTLGMSSHLFHHVYPADARMYMTRSEGKDVFVETNEDGLRTPYSKEEFRKYRHRVIVLGDSFVLGLGVATEDLFTRRLEENLRQAFGDDSVAVLNAGIVSYSPFLEKLLFERKLAGYQPTLVLLVLDASDIGDDHKYSREAVTSSAGLPTFSLPDGTPSRYRGALYELARPHIPELRAAVSFPLDMARMLTGKRASSQDYNYYEFALTVRGRLETNRYFIYRHPLSETRPYFDATMRNVDDVASLALGAGADFVFFVTPRFQHWNTNECPDNWEKREYALNEPYQNEYFRYFEETVRSYPIINLLPDFKATSSYPLVFRGDPHWNAAGNAFVADTVTRHLQRLRGAGVAATSR
jgi:hypothetical protein